MVKTLPSNAGSADLIPGFFPDSLVGKEPACNAGEHETQVRSRGREDPLEEEMAPHSSILAWEIPWVEEPGGLQSMGSQKSRTRLND